MTKILLAEDDKNLGFMIQDNLQSLGYEVHWAKDGRQGLALFKSSRFELCIFDIMMPTMDGYELARKIRSLDEMIPILFLTAKSLPEDVCMGFETGADDYITKPFSLKELDYRVKVFLRRNISAEKPSGDILTIGKSSLDAHNRTFTCARSQPISLTQRETELFVLLITQKGNLITREAILESLWGENDYFKGRSLDVFIARLRKYIKADPSLEIRNHHGVGFTFLEK